ncbi:Hpt domain-containing protein [Paraburkholderia bonniea]|uniref:Hpt domain-containing protein n=1 Tax=Paraburkholderia bonniea TaxID=2152891 RepID=UPI001290ED87|nr:Hpt domain-containing protein [Paraburkholderia bonniea]WJF91709.1 Hpt domain-containing protein [Paraburkholderia bonniea]WJF95029.1 Hpt domain-containing protein [Paraburkholderia bonniea]
MTAHTDTEWFDRPGALAFLGDEALLKEVLDAFVQSSQEYLPQLHQAIASKDAASVRRYLHRVTPTLGILASKALRAQTHEVHALWHEPVETPARDARSRALANDLEALVRQVQAELARLSAAPTV